MGSHQGSIARLEKISERTGLPAMLDVVCSTAENAKRYLEFVADVTRMPILIDYVSVEAGLSGMDVAKELGILDRTILNSINPEIKLSIFEKAREVGLQSAMASTYSAKAIISYKEKFKLFETLISKVQAIGVKKILVDTVVLDIATLGLACKAIFEVKERYGYQVDAGLTTP